MSTSPLGTPCFSLSLKGILSQDLANPLVSKHLDYYPEMTDGPHFKFSQSKKWLEDLAPQHRAQMCDVDGEHYYIFEPVELESTEIVIPVFFYTLNSKLYAKCIKPDMNEHLNAGKQIIQLKITQDILFQDPDLSSIHTNQFKKPYLKIEIDGKMLSEKCALYEENGAEQKKIPLPNDWRDKANGRIIRHIPITLYSDDTLGNVLKKFNKHISFYFTLSGLPPQILNQEYNCHFLSTSNRANVLEISGQIVAKMNEVTREGFMAFDSSIMEEVLVTGLVFCFLADSLMHAEVTNTPNPGSSLNPCQMCALHAEGKDQRNTLDYVLQFLRINPDGSEAAGSKRKWSETCERTVELYSTAIEESNAEFIRKKRHYGVTDSLNNHFLENYTKDPQICEKMEKFIEADESQKMFSPYLKLKGFDGVKDTPIEILHVVLLGFVKYLARDALSGKKLKPHQQNELRARLQLFNTQALNIPPINAKSFVNHIKSLVGKEFKILVQAAPFVFFQFLTPKRKAIWTAVCQLVPFIFVTKINNMEEYQKRIKIYIRNFMYHALQTTAQWVNKPKFHHLLHLPESILCFGPPSLYSTEKFESFNGILRNASVHSNKQSPGRDIAITFENHYSLRFLMSGSFIYDHPTHTYTSASQEVQKIFQHNEVIRRSFGYNVSALNPIPHDKFPFSNPVKIKEEDQLNVPEELIQHCSSRKIQQVGQVQINKQDVLEKGCFVVVFNHMAQNYLLDQLNLYGNSTQEQDQSSIFILIITSSWE
ncbi:hypothetical protein PTTG_28819 [Puccinia triticina 1-1 BBBD Race 1]|uniref:Uncharacterized protein n=1 Tax=Puccinia triticina (isolate 1-1 / race 1 (BBBD)) TaxID=630390 RepID=A0A180GB20_PUCT1|nr:hypothetical protein PTTG_28819 [Puccinia triticina 1-1 BBBD Race 1]